MHNILICNEWRRIWVHRTSKIEIQRGGPNNSDILQKCFLWEIRSPIFNLCKFKYPERSTPKPPKMHSNLMIHEEFGSTKLFKLKYKRGNQIIKTLCKIASPPEIRSPIFDSQKFQDCGKVTPQSCRIHWNIMNDEVFWSQKLLKLK